MKTYSNIKTFFMNYKLTIIFLFASLAAFSQNPYIHKYTIVNSNKDTTDYTLTVTGSSSFFSSKVTQRATLTNKVRPYKPPVITAPPTQNLAPTVNLGADRTYNLGAGQTTANVALAPTVADESPSTITYQWTGTGLNSTTASSVIATAPVGTNTYTVKVTDNGGLTATDEVKVTVNPFVPVPPVDPPPTTEGWPTWEPFSKNDFQTSITTGFNSYIQQPDRATTMSLSTDYPFKGTKSLKIDISKAQCDAGGNWRSELTQLTPVKTPIPGEVWDIIKEGDERWYKFYMMLPDYQKDNEESIIQWHQESGSGSPPCALYIVEDNLAWNYARKEGSGSGTTQTLMPLPKNKWFEIKMHFKWSSGSGGLSEIWIDGVSKLSLSGANMFAGQTNYLKLGLYKWAWKNGTNNPSRVPRRILYYGGWEAFKK